MNNVPRRNDTFTNKKGMLFDKVKEIAYKQGELMGNLGKFVHETKREPNIFFGEKDSLEPEKGVFIYQNRQKPTKAYRIYKEFADYGFNGYNDDTLIQELQERKDGINLTEFPTGVVTYENKIIGQEIPYYEDYMSIHEFIQNFKDIDLPTLYRMILDILKELYDHGILYYDVHTKNFLIKNDESGIKVNLIDFEYDLMSFEVTPQNLKRMLKNYASLVNGIHNYCKKIQDKVYEDPSNFEEAYNRLDELKRKLA